MFTEWNGMNGKIHFYTKIKVKFTETFTCVFFFLLLFRIKQQDQTKGEVQQLKGNLVLETIRLL